MAVPLNTCIMMEQHDVVRFLWAKDMAAKNIHKEMLCMYGEHCLSRQALPLVWPSKTIPFGGNAFLTMTRFKPLKPELNPICYLLALLAHHFLNVSRIRVKSLTFRRLMSYIYIYGAPILDVSRSHTTTQHSR